LAVSSQQIFIFQNDFSIETTDDILDEDETTNLSGDESLTHLKATIDSSKKQEAPRKETDQSCQFTIIRYGHFRVQGFIRFVFITICNTSFALVLAYLILAFAI
jgi:hypothetical protein